MVKYRLPAKEGKVDVTFPKSAKVKSWHSFGDFVIVELEEPLKKLEEFKMED